MDEELKPMQMEINMKENSKMTSIMALELTLGVMDRNTLEISRKV